MVQAYIPPFAATGITGAGPDESVGEVNDDAANGAVIEVTFWSAMFANRFGVVRMVGHHRCQGFDGVVAPVGVDQPIETI